MWKTTAPDLMVSIRDEQCYFQCSAFKQANCSWHNGDEGHIAQLAESISFKCKASLPVSPLAFKQSVCRVCITTNEGAILASAPHQLIVAGGEGAARQGGPGGTSCQGVGASIPWADPAAKLWLRIERQPQPPQHRNHRPLRMPCPLTAHAILAETANMPSV